MHTHMHTQTHRYIRGHMHTYITRTQRCTYTNIHTRKYTHTDAHTHTHTHPASQVGAAVGRNGKIRHGPCISGVHYDRLKKVLT